MGLTIAPNGRPALARSASIREALLSVSRAIEDSSWQTLTSDPMEEERPFDERKQHIERARLYLKRSPLAKQAGSLLVNYTLGQGVSVTAANKTKVARLVDEFWNDPVNEATFTSHIAMSEFLLGAFTDGAQYLVLFPDEKEGTLEIGWLDAMFVEEIVMDPENARLPMWYKVRRPKGKFDFKAGAYQPSSGDEYVWYRHWRNTSDEDDEEKEGIARKGPRPPKLEKGLMYQAKRGKGKFGTPEMQAAIDWLKAHKEFMEDRATLTRAAASVAWKKKRKSGPADIASQVDRLRSTLSASVGYGYEGNPTPAAGSTIVENEGSNLEWVKTDTGGQSALADERILRMMAGSGMGGIPNHYFGDEASANLATATAMELPLLKSFENWQKWLSDVCHDLIEFMLTNAHEAGRLGPKDDQSKYVDKQVTSEKMIDLSGPRGGEDNADVSPNGKPTGPPSKAAPFAKKTAIAEMREAFPQQAGGAVPAFGSRAGQQGGGAPAPGQPPQLPPGPLPPGQVQPPAPPPAFTIIDDQEPSNSAPVDWYVDVDFAPIVQKDLKPYVESLKVLGEMLPSENPESQRLVIQMGLIAFGVNDVDQVLDRLFPPMTMAQAKANAASQAAQQVAQQPALPPGWPAQGQQQPPTGPGQPPKLLNPGAIQPAQVQESAAWPMSPERVHRIITIARNAIAEDEADVIAEPIPV